MRTNEQCKYLCRIEHLAEDDVKLFHSRIDDDYRATMQESLSHGHR